MNEFIKYQHLERYGNDHVDGIEAGICWIFPKIDGTNGSIWYDPELGIRAGSRNRELAVDNDNAGFYNAMLQSWPHKQLCANHPHWVFFGEWLVPHSLKTYREDAWRHFYIFDVYDRNTGELIPYAEYNKVLMKFPGVDYLAPLGIVKSGGFEVFNNFLAKNVFLIEDGQGVGEGIVIKNYEFKNRQGNQIWAKIITNEFKEEHHKAMGAPVVGGAMVEEQIAEKYVSSALVDKEWAKIVNEMEGWNSKYIPRLLNTVYHCLITEEMWNILKDFKHPKIDFRALNVFVIKRIKDLRKDLF